MHIAFFIYPADFLLATKSPRHKDQRTECQRPEPQTCSDVYQTPEVYKSETAFYPAAFATLCVGFTIIYQKTGKIS